jgi:hypothetical protein
MGGVTCRSLVLDRRPAKRSTDPVEIASNAGAGSRVRTWVGLTATTARTNKVVGGDVEVLDVTDCEACTETFAGADAVVHLAALRASLATAGCP